MIFASLFDMFLAKNAHLLAPKTAKRREMEYSGKSGLYEMETGL